MKNLNSLFIALGHNITAEFYPYADIKHTIRRRNGRIYMRISDVLHDAPDEVLLSLGRILLAKLNKKRINQKDRTRYYEYVTSRSVQERASHITAPRKRRIKIIEGQYRNLNKSFERVNREYFSGFMEKPVVTWSLKRAKRTLGRYDPERDIVFISRILDSPKIPEELLDFIMYHELLHKKHGIKTEKKRRKIHTGEFRKDEKKFRNYEKMKELMENLARR
ncbi:MAG: M48 family metallopeptidase [Theionarchaea archaeon]|nr:M48 family metallopeptidase [Theionarchaea archaeon]